jgi:tetratricopeptide (TPR) repeat protein
MAKPQQPPPTPSKPAGTSPPVPNAPAAPPVVPARRSTYYQAVAVYERGLDALQRHDYSAADRLFESVLEQYAEEKELHERVRLYLNVCRRQAAARQAAPQTVEERLYASTLALNGGDYEQAITHLQLVLNDDSDNDHALYMLAVAYAQRGDRTDSLEQLERAIALNPENRALARRDPDLEPLHSDDRFRAVLDRSSGLRAGPRLPHRARPLR